MKALLIDDENKALRLLEALLLENCKDLQFIYQASNLVSGIEIIEEERPDIVFLDIEMPKHSGLQILEFLEVQSVDFQIIFVTAYNQYAIEAFKLSAVDYLLKPLDVVELKNAVEKAVKRIKEKNINSQLDALRKAFHQLALNKIALTIPKGMAFISDEDVQLFEADGMYTKVYLAHGKTELICKPLKHFVNQLHEHPIFYKPHRSYLINLKHIKEFIKKDGVYIVMDNGIRIPVSKEKKEAFVQLLHEVFE